MNGAIDSPALAAIAKSEACGKRGPRTGALCRRFKGHEQPPSPLLGADFHEAGDSQGVIERWAVSEAEIIQRLGVAHLMTVANLDSVEREIAAAEARERRQPGWREEGIPVIGAVGGVVHDAAAAATKEAELDQVNELLSAAGFLVADQFQRAGAPGSGVFYAELNQGPGSAPVIVRVQMLFGRPVQWAVVESWITDLDSLREALS
jgi:hypothetical protein